MIGVRGEWLFNEDVFPSLQRCHRQFEMRRHRRSDHDRIDLRIIDHIDGIAARLDARIKLLQRREPLLAQVANARDGRTRRAHKVAHEVWSPITVTDYTNLDHVVRSRTSPITRAG